MAHTGANIFLEKGSEQNGKLSGMPKLWQSRRRGKNLEVSKLS